jgi:hypothetical protein
MVNHKRALSPARFRYSRYLPTQGQSTETEAAELEFPVVSARTSAAQTSIMCAHRKLRCAPGFGFHTHSCHSNSRQQFRSGFGLIQSLLLPFLCEGHSHMPQKLIRLVIGLGCSDYRDVHSASLICLCEIHFGKDQLVAKTKSVVSPAVK